MIAALALAHAAPGLDVQRLDPVAPWTGRIAVRGAPDVSAGSWAFGWVAGYARRPLVLRSPGRVRSGVDHLGGLDLLAAWAPTDALRVGIALPVQASIGRMPAGVAVALDVGAGGVGPGDLAAHATWARRGASGTLTLGLPTGRRRALLGGTGLWVRADGGFERSWGRLRAAADAGVVLRAGAEDVAGLYPSHELGVGLAARLPVDPAERGWLGVELVAATVLARALDAGHTPVEGWLTARWDPAGPWSVDLGGGPGLSPGFGAPSGRVFARVSAVTGRTERVVEPDPEPSIPDADGDGVPDASDRCPDAPEVFNGVDDDDGCPDASPVEVDPTTGRVRLLWPVDVDATGAISAQGERALGALAWQVLQSPDRILVVAWNGEADAITLRLEAVFERLVALGVPRSRIRRGAARPAPEGTPRGVWFSVLSAR